MKKWILLAAATLAIIYVCVFSTSFEIYVPDVIEIEYGSGFCVDDYIEIKGNKENITLEYRDNIDVNIPGTYTLDITAVHKNGRTIEKSVTVKVVQKENKENGE